LSILYHDGVTDIFSTTDAWLIRYHPDKYEFGKQENAYNDELKNYLNNKDIDTQDVGTMFLVQTSFWRWKPGVHDGPLIQSQSFR
jgi:hypothetical protein